MCHASPRSQPAQRSHKRRTILWSRLRRRQLGGFKFRRQLRFWNNDVLTALDDVVETIYEALHRQEMDGRFD
jgi:very-short-patch-repair endonuclease